MLSDVFQPVKRSTRRFNPLKVPRKLEASLPFASKTPQLAKQKSKTYLQKRAVVMQPEEKKAVALLQQIQALRKDKVARRKAKQSERKEGYRKGVADRAEKREEKISKEKRERARQEGIKRKHQEDSAGKRKRRG